MEGFCKRDGIGLPLQQIPILFLLAAFLLLPHGMGFDHPFGLPSLDLPRLAVLLFYPFAFFAFIQNIRRSKQILMPAPGVQVCLVFVACWQVLSALLSASPKGALLWAVANLVMLWGLAFFINAMGQFNDFSWHLVSLLKVTGVVLTLLAWGEWVTQGRIFPFRNTWPDDVVWNTLNLERIYRLSIGPYPDNHYLGVALCILSGFLLIDRRRLFLGFLLIGGVLSTGFVTGFVALTMVLIGFLYLSRSKDATILLMVFLISAGTVISLGQPRAGVSSAHTPYAHILSGSDHRGSTVSRIENTISVLQQALTHSVFGFGTGAVADPARVPSELKIWSDIGGLTIHIVESGYIVGALLIVVLCLSIWRGMRSGDSVSQGGALGLIGFTITQLATPVIYFWGIALIICGLIEHRSHLSACSPPEIVSASGISS